MKGREVFELISEEACRELEAVVGSEWFSTDPVICKTCYGYGWGHEFYWIYDFSQPPAAVAYPETTEEVSKIVKICNRYGIPFSPCSQHTVINGDPCLEKNHLVVDLKRMMHIEVDEKHMHAVIGSGIIAALVQREANKKDLMYQITGGGGTVGSLCNHFSFGWGQLSWRATPHSHLRVGGLEWVNPEGEICRLGSLAVGDWYWGEGLGPDLIGFLHGSNQWCGAMGIITKGAVSIYPFQPDPLTPDGMGAESVLTLPPRVRFYNVQFPTREALDKLIDEAGKANIAYQINTVPAYWRAIAKCRGDNDFRNTFWESWEKMTEEEVRNFHVARILLVGRASLKQLEYEERVLMDIIEECGGTPRRTPPRAEDTFTYPNAIDMWLMNGIIVGTDIGWESVRCVKAVNEEYRDTLDNTPFKLDWLDAKKALPWYFTMDRGRGRYTELHIHPDCAQIDPLDPNFNPEVAGRFLPWAISTGPTISQKFGMVSLFDNITHPLSLKAQAYPGFDAWVTRFKEEFDPKNVSNPPYPHMVEQVAPLLPPTVVSEEWVAEIGKAAAGPWMGNPE